MKKLIKDFLSTIAVLGGFFGMILVMNEAVAKPLAFALMFGSMFLWFFVDALDNTENDNTDVK